MLQRLPIRLQASICQQANMNVIAGNLQRRSSFTGICGHVWRNGTDIQHISRQQTE